MLNYNISLNKNIKWCSIENIKTSVLENVLSQHNFNNMEYDTFLKVILKILDKHAPI